MKVNFHKLLRVDISRGAKPPPHQCNTKVKNDSFWIQAQLGAARHERDEQVLSSINPRQRLHHISAAQKSKTTIFGSKLSLVPRGMSAISKLYQATLR